MAMQVESRQFGVIEYTEEGIIHIPQGIIGFENLQRYLLFRVNDEEFIFWLIAIDEPEIVFPLCPIKMLRSEYPEIEKHEPFGIVRLAKQLGDVTINLKAPLYIDFSENKGFQKILDSDNYPINEILFINEEG